MKVFRNTRHMLRLIYDSAVARRFWTCLRFWILDLLALNVATQPAGHTKKANTEQSSFYCKMIGKGGMSYRGTGNSKEMHRPQGRVSFLSNDLNVT